MPDTQPTTRPASRGGSQSAQGSTELLKKVDLEEEEKEKNAKNKK